MTYIFTKIVKNLFFFAIQKKKSYCSHFLNTKPCQGKILLWLKSQNKYIRYKINLANKKTKNGETLQT